MTHYSSAAPETIRSLFDRIAHRYDLGNALCSFGLFRHWNASLVRALLKQRTSGPLLDLCCGTGEIALLAMKRAPSLRQGYLLDFSPQMLEEAERKWQLKGNDQQQLHFLQADAQQIPLPDRSIGLVSQAYGIRNVQDPVRCMREVWRVLQPGGVWAILELTSPHSPLIGLAYRTYLRLVLPWIGKVVSGDVDAYRYLARSICQFMPPDQITCHLNEVGFELIELRRLFCGAAHLWIVKKPQELRCQRQAQPFS